MKKLLFLVSALSLTLVSCKKEDSSSSLNSGIQSYYEMQVGRKTVRTTTDKAHPLQESAPKGSKVSGNSVIRTTKGQLIGKWESDFPKGLRRYTFYAEADLTAKYNGYKTCSKHEGSWHECIGGCPKVYYACNEGS